MPKLISFHAYCLPTLKRLFEKYEIREEFYLARPITLRHHVGPTVRDAGHLAAITSPK